MYNHIEIEKKWQDFWDKNNTFKIKNISNKPKFYALDMFPYPSGAGLHVGHPEGYTANDIVSRYKNAKGFNVLHPMGWDAFGLPAENYAIKTGTHPSITTKKNIETFKRQIKELGFSYDWDREIDTTDPDYYKWTQWIFLKLFENGLAYEQDLPINYCPSCKTGLANEEVLADNTCDRCGNTVEKKKIRQWVLSITKYADRLEKDVEKLDWPKGIKDMQKNWIGRSEGCEFEMKKFDEIKKTVLVLHGWGGSSKGGWKPWLKKELEKHNYNVIIPDLPDSSHPNLEKQLKFLEQYKSSLDENSIIIGHSMGAFLANHFLEKLNHKISKLIHIAGAFDKTALDEKCKKWEGYEEVFNSMNNNFEIEKVKSNTNNFTSYISKTDPYIDFDKSSNYYENNNINLKIFEDKGHFNEDSNVFQIPELLQDIISLDCGIRVYTTRIDTVFSMAFVVIAPDYKDVNLFVKKEQEKSCLEYIKKVKNESEQERTNEGKEKTGVFTGSYVINPYNNEKVPVWIGDFVLGNYGTGAVFGDAHDDRDFVFAKKYGIPLKYSIAPKFSLTGNKKIKEGVEILDRKTVTAIIKYKDKYLLLKETGNNEIYFVGGGVEFGENYEEEMKREIYEETGYKNLEVKNIILENLFSEGFRITKQKNQKVNDTFYYAEIINDERDEISDEEKFKHGVIFLDEKDVGKSISWEHHKYVWDLFINGEKAFTEDGILINSGEFNGLTSAEARFKLTQFAEKNGFGEKKVNYKLRDWLFSRQRYWGEPIPLIHLEIEDYNILPIITTNSDKLKLSDNGIFKFVKEGKDYCYIPKSVNECFIVKYYGNYKGEKSGAEVLMITTKVEGDYYEAKEISKIYDGLYTKIICDYNLPLKLPEVEKYEPAGDGQSPLANVENFVNVKLADNLIGKRETNTMPQWGGSCWYYLRFMDNENKDELVNKEIEKYWGQVDSYVGGAEHAVLHLLYARFWYKFLFDIGIVSYDEPFQKLRNQGLILAYAYQRKNGGLVPNDEVFEENGKYFEKSTREELRQVVSKMSKSLKNVVNPDEIIKEYGADSLRLYEMYISDFKDSAPWDTKNIVGVRRFLDKIWRLYEGISDVKNNEDDLKTMKLLHKTIKKVGEDIEEYKFNTAIAQMMILVNNGLPNDEKLQIEWKEKFLIILSAFTPHIAEELWKKLGNKNSIFFAKWPDYDEKLVVDDKIIIGVQVLGKLRGEIEISIDEDKNLVLEKAKSNENVAKWLHGKELLKEIYVPGKIVNLVIK